MIISANVIENAKKRKIPSSSVEPCPTAMKWRYVVEPRNADANSGEIRPIQYLGQYGDVHDPVDAYLATYEAYRR